MAIRRAAQPLQPVLTRPMPAILNVDSMLGQLRVGPGMAPGGVPAKAYDQASGLILLFEPSQITMKFFHSVISCLGSEGDAFHAWALAPGDRVLGQSVAVDFDRGRQGWKGN